MKLLLNTIEVPKEVFTVNGGLNYGRFYNHDTENYEIRLSSDEFITLIEQEYTSVRDEIKIDDEVNQEQSEFTATNYCSLLQLLNHASDLEEIVKTYLDITLLKKLFSTTSENTYVINSTDSITIVATTIIIKGRVFKIQKEEILKE